MSLLILFNSCYKHQDGCRDTNALNYDVIADVDCDDNCCKYPKVSIDFNMYVDTVTIDTNTYFSNNSVDSLRIRQLRMYFSDFVLLDESGIAHPLYNEIKIGIGNDSLPKYKTIAYNSVKISEKAGRFGIGTLDKLNVYKQIDFAFGIDSLVNHSDIGKITTSSYLHQFSDSMYINRMEGYYFMKFIVDVKDKAQREITILGDDNLQRLNLKGNIDFQDRENHILPVRIDLIKWLKNVDFTVQNDDEIKNALLQNLNSSMDIFEK